MPDTLRVLPFGSHQCLGGKGEMKELFKMAQPVSSDWQKEDSNQACPRPHAPASTTLPPTTEGRATGRKRIRTRCVHARTHPLPPPGLPQRKAEQLAERGFEPSCVHARTHPLPPPCLPQRKAEHACKSKHNENVSSCLIYT